MAASGDPVGAGSLPGLRARAPMLPGLSAFTRELLGKRLELLKEAVPGIARLAFLSNSGNPVARTQWEEMSSAASKCVSNPSSSTQPKRDMERAFEAAVAQRADALVVGNDTVTHTNRRLVVELAAKLGWRRLCGQRIRA